MVELKNVSFTYQSSERSAGIYDIDLKVNRGELVLLCGESGCGKTTLTRLINGLIPHYYEGELTGEIWVDGESINTLPLYETAKIVGSVFQNPRSQFFNLDTTSELAFSCENQGLPEEEIKKRIDATIEAMDIEKLMNRSLFALSGGEKQKIACASVSASCPEVYVLDEPSSNLDAQGIEELKKMLGAWKRQGKTIIISEHRLYFLKELIDSVIYMEAGRIKKSYTGEDFLKMTNRDLAKKGLRPVDMEDLTYGGGEGRVCEENIGLRNFCFSYTKGINAVDLQHLDVPKNSIIALVGHNGAGKSTLARCLCGLEKKSKSQVETEGEILKSKKRLSYCYMVMQDVNHQLFTESVLDEILLSMSSPDEEKANQILGELDLLDLKELHPMSLSGGQKQRVAIASAIASERQIILFDEPTSGLDLRHMQEVSKVLLKLREMGKTLFVISHDPELILSCCDYVMSIEDGKLVEHYPLDSCHTGKLLHSFYGDRKVCG